MVTFQEELQNRLRGLINTQISIHTSFAVFRGQLKELGASEIVLCECSINYPDGSGNKGFETCVINLSNVTFLTYHHLSQSSLEA